MLLQLSKDLFSSKGKLLILLLLKTPLTGFRYPIFNMLRMMLFFIETLRALYLGDNDFETLPADIDKLINLQIVSTSAHSFSFHEWLNA